MSEADVKSVLQFFHTKVAATARSPPDEVRKYMMSEEFARSFVGLFDEILPIFRQLQTEPFKSWWSQLLFDEDGSEFVSWPDEALKAYAQHRRLQEEEKKKEGKAGTEEAPLPHPDPILVEIGKNLTQARQEIQLTRGIDNLMVLLVSNAFFHFLSPPGLRFVEVREEAPRMQLLEDRFAEISAEVHAFLKSSTVEAIPTVEDVDIGQAYLSIGEEGKWRSLLLRAQFQNLDENLSHFPVLKEIFEELDDVVCMAMVSVLSGKRKIKHHHGLFWGIYRYHLPIIVPKQQGRQHITVGGIDREWEEGKAFLFDDNYSHGVLNEREGERVVLLIDTPKMYGNEVIDRINRRVLKVFNETEGMKLLRQRAELSTGVDE
uniref:Aspartyl/asparaginy/proline hydroxylase domain-containing protein n=1 Tax=Palpitomonas bilix TaxID=652834 RepID=A0A7S3D9I2_9EUKA|mmetsp:Transcript_27987/g.71214  ORF Transcript_27987/g.71214 Transcript_27987/m.71214 type:complete len:375 (+) Transcript_27987:173-1297(+)